MDRDSLIEIVDRVKQANERMKEDIDKEWLLMPDSIRAHFIAMKQKQTYRDCIRWHRKERQKPVMRIRSVKYFGQSPLKDKIVYTLIWSGCKE